MVTPRMTTSRLDQPVRAPQADEARPAIRSLQVIAGDPNGSAMIFAKRESTSMRYAGVTVRHFFLRSRTSPVSLMQDFIRMRREIREFQPQVIHAHFGTVTGLFSGLVTTKPLVVTFRGTDLNPDPTLSPLRSLLGRFFSQLAGLRAQQIICASKGLKNRLWWHRHRATVLAGSVDLVLFTPRPKEEARAALGWPTDEKIVLFNAGRFPKIKRLDLAEAAIQEANRLGCPVKMMVLNGQTDPGDIPSYMNAADCLLFTSDWEGSPYVVKEALSCNLPIVSVDVGDVAERIAGVSPSCIVPRDASALGKAVADVVALGCRSNGRLAMLENSEQKVAERVRSIYERVVSHNCETGSRGSDRPAADLGAGQV